MGRFIVRAFAVLITFGAVRASAADLIVASSANMRTFFPKVIHDVEQHLASKIIVEYAEALPAKNRLMNGEKADVAINLKSLVRELVESDIVSAPTQVDFARSEVSVVVREGARTPDIASAQAFKAALLSAKAVAYTDPKAGGASGLAMEQLLDRMGIQTEISSKAKLTPGSAAFLPMVVSGEADIGITQKAIALRQPGITIVGPIPKELEGDLIYTAGLVRTSQNADAGREFLKFLTTPEAKAALRESGLLE